MILACGPQLTTSPALAPQVTETAAETWLLFADAGTAGRPSAGAELALQLRERGDTVIEVAQGALRASRRWTSASAPAIPMT